MLNCHFFCFHQKYVLPLKKKNRNQQNVKKNGSPKAQKMADIFPSAESFSKLEVQSLGQMAKLAFRGPKSPDGGFGWRKKG